MARWREAHWEPSVASGLPRRDLRSGAYATYDPDPLVSHPVTIPGALAMKVADAERAVRMLAVGPGAEALASIARFLLRSEAIASSRIEGVAPSPQQVALAELAEHESVRGIGDQAQLVANNITVVRRASHDLVEAERLTVGHIVDLHGALLPGETHQGLRVVQNWIGGSDWNPIGADFVPPSPELVPMLMEDLVSYLNGAAHSPIVQAALVHAQFETIHPFTDGNGRVGRALIHTVLTRRGLTPTSVLPVSLVLSTLRDTYVDGLTGYRYDGDPSVFDSLTGVRRWLDVFCQAVIVAAEQAGRLVAEILDLQEDWNRRVAERRAAQGTRQTPRADSATARLLAVLPESPVVTTRTLQRILSVSFPAASSALEELADAGVLHPRSIERNTTAYLAREILDVVTHAERRLASTRFDTRAAAPCRVAPASPADQCPAG